MPGMDGLEVLKRIKEIDPEREAIVTPAFTEIDLAIKSLQLDTRGFLTKTVSNEALEAGLGRPKERYLKRKDHADQYRADRRTVEGQGLGLGKDIPFSDDFKRVPRQSPFLFLT